MSPRSWPLWLKRQRDFKVKASVWGWKVRHTLELMVTGVSKACKKGGQRAMTPRGVARTAGVGVGALINV
ncbi:hypothetical protein INR49_010461 [Caranx melampygus]|nr:hypothetical protein INR49_010461 [Caranx melampygus]